MLVISMHDETLYAERAPSGRSKGYIMKQEASESVVQAIRQVLSGAYTRAGGSPRTSSPGSWKDRPSRTNPPQPAHGQGDRDLRLIGEGLSISEIGQRLHLSVKTVGTHRERIKEKLRLKNPTELLRYALYWVEQERRLDQDILPGQVRLQ